MPFELLISRVCQEFPCWGTADAIEALEQDAGHLIIRVIEVRAYQAAKSEYERGLKMTALKDRPQGALIDVVRENAFAIAAELIAERKRKAEEQP